VLKTRSVEPRRQAGLFALIGLKHGDRRPIGYRALLPLRFDSLLQTLIENGIVARRWVANFLEKAFCTGGWMKAAQRHS
jgi:hypothetical protein